MGLRSAAFELKTNTVKKGAGDLYRELLTTQALPPERLAELSDRRAAAIAAFAMRESPFYRDRYAAAGLTAADLADPDAWTSLPIIERSDIKERTDAFYSSEANAETRQYALTGGSTGQPVRTAYDRRVDVSALSWRMYHWWGVQPWDNTARIGRWSANRKQAIKHAVSWWPTRQVYLEAGMFTPASMERFYREIRRTRPRLIEGFVGAMAEFADFLAERGLTLDSPVAVGSTAAPLEPSVRRRLEEVFRTPVYDQYRSAEVQWMAGECRQQHGLHIFSDMRRIEIVDDEGRPLPPGEIGDIVVTDFTNRVFPIIRYRLGDRGSLVAGECSCGVTLPRMAPPDGRVSDVLRLPDGSVLAHRLMAIFSTEPDAVRLFQIHQHADYSIELRVVLGDIPDARAAVDRVADILRERTGGQVPVTVRVVESLPYTRGKIKYLSSDVGADRPGSLSGPGAV